MNLKQKGFFAVVIIFLVAVGFLLVLGVGYYLGVKNSTKIVKEVSQSPIPKSSVVTDLKLTEKKDETASWKIYSGETIYTTDGSSSFTIKYPSEWEIEKNFLYPFGKPKAGESFNNKPVITLGAGGHGVEAPSEDKVFPAGTARYFWETNQFAGGGYASFTKNNIAYIFEAQLIPVNESKKIEEIFNKMLTTLIIKK